jgi:hypothetical protein
MEKQDFEITRESGREFSIVIPNEDSEYTITIAEEPQLITEYIDVEFDFFCKIKKFRSQNMLLRLFVDNRALEYTIDNGQKSFFVNLPKGKPVSGELIVSENKSVKLKQFVV